MIRFLRVLLPGVILGFAAIPAMVLTVELSSLWFGTAGVSRSPWGPNAAELQILAFYLFLGGAILGLIFDDTPAIRLGAALASPYVVLMIFSLTSFSFAIALLASAGLALAFGALGALLPRIFIKRSGG